MGTGKARTGRWATAAASAAIIVLLPFLPLPPVAASTPSATPRIVNGTAPDDPGAYPWLVSLLAANRIEREGVFQAQFCAGTLTTPTTVVTAAHCVVDQNSRAVRAPGDIVIGFGSDLRDSNVRLVGVSTVTVSPQYVIKTAGNDIAVLTLAQPVDGVPTLKPVTPAEAPALTSAGSPVRAAGWGNTSTTSKAYPQVFRVGRMVVFPDASCGGGEPFTVNGVTFKGFSSRNADASIMLCAAGVNSDLTIVDACQGDSGGPLISSEGDAARLVGIVSWGEDCASSYPGVYTRVAAEFDFLTSANAVPIEEVTVPDTAPVVTAAPRSGRLLITMTIAPEAGAVTAFAASVVDPVTGQVWNCFAEPRPAGRPSQCAVEGLTNGRTYQVTAIAGNPEGNSPVSAPVIATPLPLPDPGTITRLTSPRANTIRARVTPTVDNGVALPVNQLVCRSVKSGREVVTAITGPTVTVTGLRPQRYRCLVRAANDYGSLDSPSRAVTVRG